MAKIEESVINPRTNFVYNGLEYKKGSWEFYYTNKEREVAFSENLDKDKIKVGIRNTYIEKVLQSPLPINLWVGSNNIPFTDLSDLLQKGVPIISFSTDAKIGLTQRVDTFGDLVSGTLEGDLAYVEKSQGTQWLPSTLGGTYYPSGWYVWDGSEWLSDRNAIAKQLQENIDNLLTKVDKSFLGWVQVTDGQYTSTTPYEVGQNVRTKLVNDSSNILNLTNLFGAITLWDSINNKFQNDNSGDSFSMRVQFVANPSLSNKILTLELDIGGAQGVIWSKTIPLVGRVGTDNRISESIHFYTLDTFISNGGELYLTCDSDVEVFDIRFLIERNYRHG